MNNKIIDQIPMMEYTKTFVKKYGLKVKWIAKKTDIPDCRLSAWMNGNELLYAHQFERMKDFLDEYEQCMENCSFMKEN